MNLWLFWVVKRAQVGLIAPFRWSVRWPWCLIWTTPNMFYKRWSSSQPMIIKKYFWQWSLAIKMKSTSQQSMNYEHIVSECESFILDLNQLEFCASSLYSRLCDLDFQVQCNIYFLPHIFLSLSFPVFKATFEWLLINWQISPDTGYE